MSAIPFNELVKHVQQLTPAEKARLTQLLERQSESEGKSHTNGNGHSKQIAENDKDSQQEQDGHLAPGWGKGMVTYMSEDFDEPLEDFKEYM